ncbi:Os05g0492400 [Oryza sativa Japonica Group]|uniref:Os05g0492400 protein n=1 Tax=Oryza sativa subsp. japonica TaxID=39947 RepID=A0A0P0WP54_ORYSJ|nr:Os05g0492400 [Oryza sativa Japonica Group]
MAVMATMVVATMSPDQKPWSLLKSRPSRTARPSEKPHLAARGHQPPHDHLDLGGRQAAASECADNREQQLRWTLGRRRMRSMEEEIQA